MLKKWIFLLSFIHLNPLHTETLAEMGIKWQTQKESASDKQKTLEKTKSELELLTREMKERQSKMASLINNLRQKQDLAIPFSLVQSRTFDDTIHTLILFNRLKPRFTNERKNLVFKVKAYHLAKKLFAQEHESLDELTKEIKALEAGIDEKTSNQFKGDEAQEKLVNNAISEKQPKILLDLAVILQSINSSQHPENNSVINIHQPVRGLLKTITEDAEDNHVYVRIQSFDDEYVLAPWSGTVLYAGDFNDKKTLAVQHGDMILLMQGLMNIHCKVGDKIDLGEPIAKLSQSTSPDVTFVIYKGDQVVDPLPFMTQKA